MSESKKSTKSTKKTVAKPDVEQPGKSAPAATSKPVIVTHRPIMKDPMMVEDDESTGNAPKEDLAHAIGPKLQPLSKPEEPEAGPKTNKEEPAAEPDSSESETAKPAVEPEKKPENEPEAPEPDEGEPDEDRVPESRPAGQDSAEPKQKAEADAARKKEQAIAVEKLIMSGKYRLPINSVEKRKTKRFVALGILLAIILVLVWADIALDAGLIKAGGVKPVTHFFSN